MPFLLLYLGFFVNYSFYLELLFEWEVSRNKARFALSLDMLRRPTQNILLRLVRTNSSQTPSASTTTAAVSTSPKPTSLTEAQSPNRVQTWSTMQRPRSAALTGPLFEQTDMSLQPMPLSAMQLVSEYEPVRVHGRRAVCDGGMVFFPSRNTVI